MPRPLVLGGVVVTDVPTAIALYEPRRLPLAAWLQVASFARASVTAFEPASPWAAVQYLSTTAQFSVWALAEYLPLQAEELFTPDVVERFTAVGMPTLQESSRRTHRSRLATMGRKITRRAPWPPQQAALPRNRLAPPYSEEEVAAYFEVAEQQPTGARTRAAFGLLAGGLGAGLMPGEHLIITGSSVTRNVDDVTVLNIAGTRARPIPILAAYAPLVRTLAARFPDEPLIGTTGRKSKNRLNQLVSRIEVPARLPALTAPRLRTTWLVTLMTAGIPLPELLAVAGLASTGTLVDLLPHVPRLSAQDAAQRIADALAHAPGAAR
ncbi:hypothetical protein [Streptantibioticus ferralitis]|uniref:Uncharacterized protein n=1 Tax=Streptantibioticus ferralitis TaxID=236510 RepID=A0ABT5Z5V9_9ACTN|nr:hypothetical protein [Streptantibioticus ferralitis]MDF2258931.1 hypothetical protein [Streptantibioticus ferralitis]